MENLEKKDIQFPGGLIGKDIELIKAQCELQKATSSEQLLGFAEAYLEAKNLSKDEEKMSSLGAEEWEDLILHWAEMIEKRNEKGYRTTADRFGDFSLALKAEQVPRAMESFAKVFRNMTAEEAYTEFEKIHPFEDGNGRLGDLLWKIAVTKEKGKWPEELPPDLFKKDNA